MDRASRIVIIGAGIVGTSLADELTQRGCTNVTVLDQGPLWAPGGSTSHAPGGVFQTNFNQSMTQFAQYTVKRLGELDLDGLPCFYPAGSIEVAATPGRWQDLKRKHGVATSWGTESYLLTPEQCREKMPLIDVTRIYGGLYVPGDGVAKPVRTVEAFGRLAASRGAVFKGDTEVTGFDIVDGQVRAVETTRGRFEADVVVCCAGIWGPKVGRLAGVTIPLVPMQHQYTVTTAIPELAHIEEEVTFPLVRHQDRDMYFRQHGNRYGAGSYAHRPMPLSAHDLLPVGEAPVMPSVWEFTPDDFAPSWQDTIDLLPALGGVEIEEAMNGIFSFTVDGFPLMGESPVKGFWMAEAVWITHGPGVSRAMAEWMVEGEPGVDLRNCDIHRFEPFQLSPSYVLQRSVQGYIEVYDVKHPLEPMEEPRPLRTSPFYPREIELGANFLEAAGWERPQWFEANAPLADGLPIPPREPWSARYWSPTVGAEHLITRERVAMFDMQSLSKVEISGPGALAFLQMLTTGNMDRKIGSVTYTLMLDERAGIKSDITVARLAADRFRLGCNGPRDLDWFREHLPTDGSVQVRDITAGTCCIGVWGPLARDLVQSTSLNDFSEDGHPFFTAREAFIGEVPVIAWRLSYVGELGWEIYANADHGLRLWDLLWRAGRPLGVIAGGRGAFDSLRVEKGYRFYGRDMWTNQDPYEAGVGFAVSPRKTGYIGYEALARRREEGPRQRLVSMTLDDPMLTVMGSEPVYDGDRPVGFVTSAAYGYSIGRGIVYAWVPPHLAEPGTRLAVEYFAEKLPVTVQSEPIFDPGMDRMRVRRAVAAR